MTVSILVIKNGCNFEFLTDMTQHLNDINVELQRKEQFIHNLYDLIQGFERKLKL